MVHDSEEREGKWGSQNRSTSRALWKDKPGHSPVEKGNVISHWAGVLQRSELPWVPKAHSCHSENTCSLKALRNMLSTLSGTLHCTTSPTRLKEQKQKQKDCKSQRSETTAVKYCPLNMTGLWTYNSYGFKFKTYARSGQSTLQCE